MAKSINFYLDKFLGIEIIRSRPKEAIQYAKNYFKNKAIIAIEIGVHKGQNSEDLLKNLNIKKIYLIDPYLKYGDYKKDANYSNINFMEKAAKKRLQRFHKKIVWIKAFSEKAIAKISEKVDLVYVDGNHEYNYVKKDLSIYWKKLNKGGILSGHDIQYLGVSKALLEFSEKNKVQIHFGDRRDWWIIK
jgi:hypothetical protein